MAYQLGEQTRITINLGEKAGENPVLIFRDPTNKELHEFLSSRYKRIGTEVVDNSYQSREIFMRTILTGVEKVEYQGKPLSDYPEWQGLVPLNWLMAVAPRYEEAQIVAGDFLKP